MRPRIGGWLLTAVSFVWGSWVYWYQFLERYDGSLFVTRDDSTIGMPWIHSQNQHSTTSQLLDAVHTQLLATTLCPANAPLLDIDNPHSDLQISRAVLAAIDAHQNNCRKVRFLVVPLTERGLGANFRLGLAPALMAGLATNRVVLPMNGVSSLSPPSMSNESLPTMLRRPWPLASDCSATRPNYSCFFQDLSRCIPPTVQQLSAAPILSRAEMRRMFRTGEDPRPDQPVLLLQLKFRPQREPPNLRQAVCRNWMELVSNHRRQGIQMGRDASSSKNNEEEAIARQILDLPDSDASSNTSFSYYGRGSPIFRMLMLYVTRPRMDGMRERLQALVQRTVQTDEQHQQQSLVGMPIRGSDKCGVESACLSFAQHVRAVQSVVGATTLPQQQAEMRILATTESKAVAAAREQFERQHPGNATFLVNAFDTMPDTGYYYHDSDANQANNNASRVANASMLLSSVSSLALHLQHADWVLGNCCSNFHLLLADLMQACRGNESGVGGKRSPFMCLQDHADPEFRISCAWG